MWFLLFECACEDDSLFVCVCVPVLYVYEVLLQGVSITLVMLNAVSASKLLITACSQIIDLIVQMAVVPRPFNPAGSFYGENCVKRL